MKCTFSNRYFAANYTMNKSKKTDFSILGSYLNFSFSLILFLWE
jgi:hypothetical protein